MRRNKGYTLVELMVAIAVLVVVLAELGNLIVNSMLLYRNGTYEVNLQAEAQQVILQLEDLMMSANQEIYVDTKTYGADDTAVASDVITIKTSVYDYDPESGAAASSKVDVTYQIGLEFFVPAGASITPVDSSDYGEPEHSFARLVMAKTVGSGSGAATTYAVMADGVHSIHIDTTNTTLYETETGDDDTVTYKLNEDGSRIIKSSSDDMTGYVADMVIIQVNMQNNKYHYSASKDIYLRNQIGSGGPDIDFKTTPSFSYNLNVLRIHKYDLLDVAPSAEYKYFMFKDASFASIYKLEGTKILDSEGNVIAYENAKIYADMNSSATGSLADWSKSVESCAILCSTSATNWASAKTINVYTEAFSMDDMPLFLNTVSDGKEAYSIIPVHGACVCPECLKQVRFDNELYLEFPTETAWYKMSTGKGFNFDQVNKAAGSPLKVDNAIVSQFVYDVTGASGSWGSRIRRQTTLPGSTASYEDVSQIFFDSVNIQYNGGNASYIYNGSPYFQFVGTNNNGNPKPGINFLIDKKGDTNALAFSSTDVADGTGTWYYWNHLVIGGHGYIRFHITCRFKVDASYVEKDCYAYIFPNPNSGSPTVGAANRMWALIGGDFDWDESYAAADSGSSGSVEGGSGESDEGGSGGITTVQYDTSLYTHKGTQYDGTILEYEDGRQIIYWLKNVEGIPGIHIQNYPAWTDIYSAGCSAAEAMEAMHNSGFEWLTQWIYRHRSDTAHPQALPTDRDKLTVFAPMSFYFHPSVYRLSI